MTRIRFENLPSTNTPRTAENLNKLNNVVISSAEPNTGEEVWLEKGKNLFDKNNVINGYRLSSAGALYAETGYSTGGFIAVAPSTSYVVNYTINTYANVCYYDENKTFISRNTNTNPFTTPATCKYIRTSLLTTDLNTAQLELGSSTTTYEEFKPHKIYENKDGYYDLFTETVSVGNTVGNGRVNFIKGKNLYNKNASLDGYALSSSSGEIAANAGWTTSDFIPVVPNASIYISGKPTQGNGVCCYNASKTFVSTVTCREGTMTTPANCYYIRINLAIADKDTCQVEYGTTATGYEPYATPAIVVDNDEIYSKGHILFDGKSNTNLALSDNINNYKYLEIFYTNASENMWDSKKIPVTATTKTVLQRMNVSNTSEKQITQFFFKTITLSGTSLTVNQNRALFMESVLTDYTTLSGTSSSDNTIYITKIVGYK